jgi:4-amino-4-deoxy-L-arabinose transferase-like glycosyltransferase
MMIILLFFLVNVGYEMAYLKKKNRKKRTYWIVFCIMGVSFSYCMATVVFKQMPSPNNLILFLFKPLQQKILG